MRLTTLPFGPVWCVTSVEPSRRLASFSTSSIDLTTLTPPALPRPPAWICAFTTQRPPPRSVNAFCACSGVSTGMPFGTGTPWRASTSLAWYSWMFMGSRTKGEEASERARRVQRRVLVRPAAPAQGPTPVPGFNPGGRPAPSDGYAARPRGYAQRHVFEGYRSRLPAHPRPRHDRPG